MRRQPAHLRSLPVLLRDVRYRNLTEFRYGGGTEFTPIREGRLPMDAFFSFATNLRTSTTRVSESRPYGCLTGWGTRLSFQTTWTADAPKFPKACCAMRKGWRYATWNF